MKRSIPKYALISIFSFLHLWQASLVRPVADDYTLLNIYSRDGFSGFISYFWNTFGGNVSPAIIRAIFLSDSIDGSNWLGFAAFSLLTSVLVVVTYLVVIAWLTNRKVKQLTLFDLMFALLASLAIEGLFTPGLSSAYLFGAASGVHLWPICIFILTIKLVGIASNSISITRSLWFTPVLIVLGFIIGNSGIAEAAAIVFGLSLLLGLNGRFSQFLISRMATKALWLLQFGLIVGFATIFIAPGFKTRNQKIGSLDLGFSDLLINFRSSTVSFTGELITHPIWILVLLSIFLISSSKNSIDITKAKVFCFGFIILLFMLVIGGTFGYAAWHQSSGLIFLFTPALICLTVIFAQRFFRRVSRISHLSSVAIPLVGLLLVCLAVRGLYVQEVRSSTWDANLISNYCLLNGSNDSPLKGSEIKYWPIGLGIEDVNRWDWMKKDYEGWLNRIKLQFKPPCTK